MSESVCVCAHVKLVSQVCAKLLLPFFSYISHHRHTTAVDNDDDDDDDDDNAVDSIGCCIADALFSRFV